MWEFGLQILPLQSCELKKMPPSPSAREAFFSIHTPGAGGFEPEFSHLPLWIVEFPIEFSSRNNGKIKCWDKYNIYNTEEAGAGAAGELLAWVLIKRRNCCGHC